MSKHKHDLLLINAKGLKKIVSRMPIYGEPNTNIDVYHSKTGFSERKSVIKVPWIKNIIDLIIIIIIVTILMIIMVLFVLQKGN